MHSIIVPLIEKRLQMQGVCVLVFVGWALFNIDFSGNDEYQTFWVAAFDRG